MENEDYRAALKAELLGLKENGVSFSLNGKIVEPGERLVDQLLTDKDCTYMRNYRMNYAASLLRSDKTLKVAEIAGLVGYDSPSKFASAFHQTMGKTPLEYRKSII